MRIHNKQLVMDKKNCTVCNGGFIPTKTHCDKCDGTGRGVRGGRNGCKKCYGTGHFYDHENKQTCTSCNGSYVDFMNQTPFDFMKLNKNDIPIKVIREYQSREMSFSEQYIGCGLFSCTDYGRHKNQTDDEIIESAFHFEENGEFTTQGIKLVRDKNDLRICDAIYIVLADQGYSVIPFFEEA